jgi:hypothetical protein
MDVGVVVTRDKLNPGDWFKGSKRHLFKMYIHDEFNNRKARAHCGRTAWGGEMPNHELDDICSVCLKFAIRNKIPVLHLSELKELYPGIVVTLKGKTEDL